MICSFIGQECLRILVRLSARNLVSKSNITTVLFAGIIVVGVYQSRFEYDESDTKEDFSEKAMLTGLAAGQALLGVGFLGQLIVYSLNKKNEPDNKDMSKRLLQAILLIFTVSSWWYFAFIMMDYSDDKNSYGNKIHGLRTVTEMMGNVYVGLVIGISTLSYKGMVIEEDQSAFWKSMIRMVAVASSILFSVFYILDLHSLYTTGGSHSADSERNIGFGDKYFGEVGINKISIIGQSAFAVLAACSFFAEAVMCFITLEMEMIYNGLKYILAGAGFVFVSLGSIYGAHAEFGTKRQLPAYEIMISIGIQFFAYAMVFFALNSKTPTMGSFMKMTSGHNMKGMYY